jgi:electron transfer flavoprotein alpha subunit
VDKIWVLAEQKGGEPASSALELLTAARGFASTVEAVTFGSEAASAAGALGEHGAAKVYDAGDLGDSLAGSRVAAAMAALIESKGAPDAIFVAQSYDGRDVAGRLSARLGKPVLTNVVGLSDEGGALVSEHAIFGGTKVLKAKFTASAPGIFVIRPKSFAAEPAGGGAAEVESIELPDTGKADAAKVLGRHEEERSGPQLDEAEVVVSGGRGLGSAENYALIEDLAKLLHGAPGASRAIVDAGWVPYSHQVGQTGKTVKPTVYIACGISGATQHMVGMKSAKHIIAVNKDESAPIFTIADLGVVGDVHSVLPKLIEAIKSRK